MTSSAADVASKMGIAPLGAFRYWALRIGRIRYHKLGVLGLVTVSLLVVLSAGAPWLAPYDPNFQFAGNELAPPGADFLLGTDRLGRDVLSRLLYGGRPTMLVSLLAVPASAVVGTLLGVIGGYFRGPVDAVAMRLMDLILAFPAVLIGIAVVAIRGPGVVNVALAIAIAGVPEFARVSRAVVLELNEREFVEAARSIGCSNWRITTRDLLPNLVGTVLVQIGVAVAIASLLEAGLSFLGLGAQLPDPSWGNMLSDSRAVLRQAPLLGVLPGLLLAIFVTGVNFVVDALRDVLDVRHSVGVGE